MLYGHGLTPPLPTLDCYSLSLALDRHWLDDLRVLPKRQLGWSNTEPVVGKENGADAREHPKVCGIGAGSLRSPLFETTNIEEFVPSRCAQAPGSHAEVVLKEQDS